MPITNAATPEQQLIAHQNDVFRSSIKYMRTPFNSNNHDFIAIISGLAASINAREIEAQIAAFIALLKIVINYNKFDDDDDPHNEHDMGFFEFEGERCMWKIDLYDTDLQGYSTNPTDPDVTRRVLTIIYACDY